MGSAVKTTLEDSFLENNLVTLNALIHLPTTSRCCLTNDGLLEPTSFVCNNEIRCNNLSCSSKKQQQNVTTATLKVKTATMLDNNTIITKKL